MMRTIATNLSGDQYELLLKAISEKFPEIKFMSQFVGPYSEILMNDCTFWFVYQLWAEAYLKGWVDRPVASAG